jgi:hypothetical protein
MSQGLRDGHPALLPEPNNPRTCGKANSLTMKDGTVVETVVEAVVEQDCMTVCPRQAVAGFPNAYWYHCICLDCSTADGVVCAAKAPTPTPDVFACPSEGTSRRRQRHRHTQYWTGRRSKRRDPFAAWSFLVLFACTATAAATTTATAPVLLLFVRPTLSLAPSRSFTLLDPFDPLDD